MVIYIFIVDIITTFLVLLDVWYFRGFQTMPSALLLSQTSNLDNMTGSIMSMISSYDYLFILDLIILPICFLY
ncbi:phosphoglycerol transferase MdoB-like AlkP superfamily enzyme [Clostridium saccharobutylicum]|nr:phosphoglycerol transferase MdoB-like AlkP superfamily enzyme [Clostridium saccharobutylicum]